MADLNIGNSSASVVVNAKHNGSVIPQINNTYDLGTSALRWKNIYGNLNGNADSATKLATARTISLTGSVTGSGTFDGSGNLSIATTTNHTHNYAGSSSAGGPANSVKTNLIIKLNGGTNEGNNLFTFNGSAAKTINITPSAIGASASGHTHAAATTSANGFMSSDDKAKLDGITASADAVSFSRSLTSGTKVGTITINGTGTDLYAPTNTDTHWTTGLKVGASNTATANAAASNGSVYLNVLDNSTVRDSHKIVGSGATSVTSDANGVITISSTDNNTTYSAGAGLTLSGTQFGHSNSITPGTVEGDIGKTLTFGGTFKIPIITYDAQGHITGKGTRTMTMPSNPNIDTRDTTGSSNTSSKIFLVGATLQVPDITTYSHATTYVNSDDVLVSSGFTAGINHIIAPKGGQYRRDENQTGYLKITLPVTSMIRFYVDIYNNQTDSIVTYMIGGYADSTWRNVSAVAYGRKGSRLSNLKVSFGHDGSKCAIYIGYADTEWDYPQVMVRDVLVGIDEAISVDSGWSIGFTTTLGTITETVDNPYIGYNAYTADNVAWSGITSKPSYYDAKAIKSITRSGTTFTATHLDGTTSTFTQQDTTYGSMSVDEGTTGTATTNRVLTASNLKGIINAHAPTKTGSGASGTWGISIGGNAATASKVNNKLTVGSKSYDGSAPITIAASDLGLASAMLFLGTTTTAITDGATTNPVVLGGSNKTVTAGNVVLYGSKEFVWTGRAWEELGNEGSYKIVQAAVADPSASGTSNTFIATISQDTNGKITATKKTVAVTNSAPTLAWSTTSTIGTVAGTSLQVKMPANPNTDTKVTQTAINATDYTNWRPLIWGSSNSGTEGFTPSTLTDGVYTAQTLSCQPSTGTIRATTFKGSLSGNATTATKLATARTIQTNLASTSAASFDGSGNITPGVTGTLPIANGGTGATTASAARNNLGAQSKVLYGPSAPSDSTGSNGDMYVALESGDFKKDIVDLIYPVGSIYISMNSTNPSTLFGGTWEAFGQGRVLIGAGTGNDGNTSLSFPAGFTGGEYKHRLATDEIPSHSHSFSGTTAANNRSHTHTYVKATGVREHTLTVAEMPSHEHAINYSQSVDPSGWPSGSSYYMAWNPNHNTGYIKATATGGGGSHNHGLSTSSTNSDSESRNHTHTFSGKTKSTGSGSSHNNIQPYIGVYMWKRTA